jgi:SynChlorMet cassette protein ScmD
MLNPDLLIANPKVVLHEGFDDYAVLFHPDTNQSFGLNPIGLLIWKMLDRKHPLAEIFNAIREQCNEVPENMQNDVESFLTALLDCGFAGYADGSH